MKHPAFSQPIWLRALLMLLAASALLGGLWAGLARLGWALPRFSGQLPGQHGPLMVSGFLGTLICLERAVALEHHVGRGWRSRLFYLAPLLVGLGGLLLFVTVPTAVSRTLILLGSLGLCLIFIIIYRRQPTPDHAVMGLAALLWLIGNALWLMGTPLYEVLVWWSGFLILTIAGERLELGRVLRHSRSIQRAFYSTIALFLCGALLSLFSFTVGVRLAGAGLLALGLWLSRYDLARHTIRRQGLTRYIAACLLLGYGWLIVGGGLWLFFGGQASAGPLYDALVHTLLLGFVFSMIFGHAPIIIPAVLGTAVPYTRLFYLPLSFLHLSLLLRLVGDTGWWLSGTLAGWWQVRRWGGLLNEVSITLFLLLTVGAVLYERYAQGQRHKKRRPS
ncbi:MAG: hypothetical protein KDD89_02455 [Anaerolineales bacterium]|nr:hypothetical protein [Anaerolineales bacterium]